MAILPLSLASIAAAALGVLAWTTWTWGAEAPLSKRNVPASVEAIPIDSAVIEVRERPSFGSASSEPNVTVDGALMARRTLTHAAMVNSTAVLEAALKMPQVKAARWFSGEPASALQRLRKAVSVRAVEGTNLIAVSFTGDAIAREKAELASAVAMAYVARVRKTVRAAAESEIALVRAQIAVRRKQLAEVRNSMRRVRRVPASPADLARQGAVLMQRLRDSAARVFDAGAVKALRSSQFEAVRKLLDAGRLTTSPRVRNRAAQDYRLRLLLDEQAEVASQLRATNAGADAKGRTPEGLKKQSRLIGAVIAEREKTLADQAVTAIQAELKESLNGATARQLRAKEGYNEIARRVQDIEAVLIELSRLAEQEATVKERIERLDTLVTEMSLRSANALPLVLRRRAEIPDSN